MTTSIILVLLSSLLGFCLSLIVLIFWQKIKNRNQLSAEERIQKLRKKAETILENEEDTRAFLHSFENTLQKAEKATPIHLQNINRQIKADQAPPEKYVILKNLAERGLKSDELANILGISGAEAAQLIKLHSIANMGAR